MKKLCKELLVLFMSLFLLISTIPVKANESINIDKFYISEDNYLNDMENKVEPFLNKVQHEGTIVGKEDLSLYYRYYLCKNAKGSIVICHGFSEYIEKYNELIYYFLKSNYNVFIMEHRGHGRSGNLGIADKTQVSVENFSYYIEDLKKFIDDIVVPKSNGKKLFLFAHSMGGGIGANFIEKYQNYFNAAVLSSPMFEINTGSTPINAAKVCAKIFAKTNPGRYVFGEGPYEGNQTVENAGTSSQGRLDYSNKIRKENPQLQRGGPSFKWLDEAFNADNEIMDKKNIERIKNPVLVTQAENDTYVNSKKEDQFVDCNDICKLIKVDGSRHESYREVDSIQKPYLIKVLNFYDSI